jgi:hypothetical protein
MQSRGKVALKPSNIKYFKFTAHYFSEKVINKNVSGNPYTTFKK